MWNILSDYIKKNILETNTKIQSVYNYEATQFDGTPTATLTPSGNESDYVTTTENGRVYAFMLRLYVERKSGADDEYNAEAAMRDLSDDVLDDLDKNHRLSGLTAKTGYCFLFMEAAPSIWGYAGAENNFRIAEVIIRVHFDIDVNLIT